MEELKSSSRAEVVPVLLEPHGNADSLSIVSIFDGGYKCCVKTADWQSITRAAYIPPDSTVDVARPEFTFLALEAKSDGRARIKAKKLRGVVSFGLLVPAKANWEIGQDVTEELGVEHYEPPLEVERKRGGLSITGGEATSGPNLMVPKYDLESFRKYHRLFQEGELVHISEKCDGCLQYDGSVTMADGSRGSIGKLVSGNKIGTEVLGVDENGKVVSTPITHVFKHPSTDTWLSIRGRRHSAGKGPSIFHLTLTPNHKVMTNNGYVEAENLKVGDGVFIIRTDLGLTPIHEQILLGKLLGDGSLAVGKNEYPSAEVTFSHCEEDKEYVDWTIRGLGQLASETSSLISGFGSKMFRGRTTRIRFIYDKFSSFIQDGRKTVPNWVADELSPLSLAFWYMDDGSISYADSKEQEACATFSTCLFTKDECEVLLRGLRRFSINGVYYVCQKGYSYIRLNADDADRLFLLVAPYIPLCMQRKLPIRYRHDNPWLPPVENFYKPFLVPHKIESIDTVIEKAVRYDIETGTHNFFAHGILVHNSNFRAVYHDGNMYCGSRTEWKKEFPTYDHITIESLLVKGLSEEKAKEIIDKLRAKPPRRNLWWQAALDNPSLEKFCRDNPDVVVYLEVFGGVNAIVYGFKEGNRIAAFDVLKEGRWLDYTERTDLLYKYGVPVAPHIISMPYEFEKISLLADGLTLTQGARPGTIREGVVIEPDKMRYDSRIGRMKLKLVSGLYLEKYR